MNKHRSQHSAGFRQISLVACAAIFLGFSGCKAENMVHQRSISELNQKAQAMMQAGDYDGAISRLEAAHDLEPEEPNTTYNLAVAYQTKGEYQKAIVLFNTLLEKPGPDGSPMSAAELHKNMGITYEAQADKLEAEANTLKSDPKGDKAKAAQVEQEATTTLKEALMHYQKALPGLKDSEGIATQIKAIETKIENSGAGAQP